jgi:hypothetical protein
MEVKIQLQPKAGELGPQHNPPGSSGTRENILEFDPNENTFVSIRAETVEYGLYDGKPAALIILKFVVRFRLGYNRLRSFHIDIAFEKHGDSRNDPAIKQPRVVTLAPEDLRGKIFTEEATNTVSGGIGISLGPLAPNLQLSDEIARKINKQHELRLTGWKRSSKGAVDDVVVWDCVEAKKMARGVVPGYRGVILVEYSSPFQASFALDADRGLFNLDTQVFDWLNVFGKKDVDDPVVFNPTEKFGKQFGVADFKDLKLDDLIELEPIATLPEGYS